MSAEVRSVNRRNLAHSSLAARVARLFQSRPNTWITGGACFGYDAMHRKAQQGHVTGGRGFGYDNVRIAKGHVERRINPEQAPIVRWTFEKYDAGLGLKKICKQLTAEGAEPPKPFVRRDPTKCPPVKGWSPSTVAGILKRELYRGVEVWNQSRKRNRWGQHDQQPRPAAEHMRRPAEHLRIIDDALWQRVQARRRDIADRTTRFSSGRLTGGSPKTGAPN